MTGATPPPPAGAAAPPGGALGALFPLLMALPIVVMFLWSSRSQKKQQQELETKLKVGDRVLTQSGLIGKLIEKGDKLIKLEVAPGVKVQMTRASIVGLDATDETAAPAKTKETAK
ncbi:MAG: preprotein translocase subunit YajC [Myxococcales bacterium]|nr:MAG: preprotein translocase subunit YajC [Myxococcales bacterium]